MKIVVSALRSPSIAALLVKAQDPINETVHFYNLSNTGDDADVIEQVNDLQSAILFQDSEKYLELEESVVDDQLQALAASGDVDQLDFGHE